MSVYIKRMSQWNILILGSVTLGKMHNQEKEGYRRNTLFIKDQPKSKELSSINKLVHNHKLPIKRVVKSVVWKLLVFKCYYALFLFAFLYFLPMKNP